MSKTAIILGSTGLTGSHLLRIALESDLYDRVVIFVRKKSGTSHPKLEEHVVEFDNPDSYSELVRGDDLFCCLGTTIKKAGSQAAFAKVDLHYPIQFAKAASENGVKQYLIVTSIGANSKSGNFYIRTKGQCEDELQNIPFKSVSIFRPSLLLGDRKEFRFGEKAGELLMKGVSFLLLGRLKRYKAIESEKVAAAMFAVALQNKEGYSVYDGSDVILKTSLT